MLIYTFFYLHCSAYEVIPTLSPDRDHIHLSMQDMATMQIQRNSISESIPDYLVRCPKMILCASNAEKSALLELINLKQSHILLTYLMVSSLSYAINKGALKGFKNLSRYLTSSHNDCCSYNGDFLRLLAQKEGYLRTFNKQASLLPLSCNQIKGQKTLRLTSRGKRYLQSRLSALSLSNTQENLLKELNKFPLPLYTAVIGEDFFQFFRRYMQFPQEVSQISSQEYQSLSVYQFMRHAIDKYASLVHASSQNTPDVLPPIKSPLSSSTGNIHMLHRGDEKGSEASASSIELEEIQPLIKLPINTGGLRHRKNATSVHPEEDLLLPIQT